MNFAASYRRRGEPELAPILERVGAGPCGRLDDPLLERSLHLEFIAGPDHPRAGESLNLLAALELLSGNLDAARECHTRALELGVRKEIERVRAGG